MTLPPLPDGHATPNGRGCRGGSSSTRSFRPTAAARGGGADGSCYQVVVTFVATAEALRAWKEEGSGAQKLFERFIADAPEGVTPASGDIDVKERLKLLPKVDNMKSLGLGWVEKYNGKPALLTKSGSLYRGDDYVEVDVNTMRFAYLTKKGINYVLNRVKDMEIHAAFTLEGRENDELPEQTLLAAHPRPRPAGDGGRDGAAGAGGRRGGGGLKRSGRRATGDAALG